MNKLKTCALCCSLHYFNLIILCLLQALSHASFHKFMSHKLACVLTRGAVNKHTTHKYILQCNEEFRHTV
jgi:hypothetical protein